MDKKDLRKIGSPITDEKARMRVDRYLGLYFPFLSRTSWQKRCLAGKVYNNSEALKPSYKLKSGDQIFHHYPQSSEPEIRRDVFCINRHEHMMAVYKPPNLPMHEGGKYRQNTFFELVKQKWGADWRAVHRLDKETSGIVVCSNSHAMRSQLAHAFRQQSTQKIYYAISLGTPPASSWMVNQPIGITDQTSWRTKRWVVAHGKKAITHFHVIATYQNFAFLKVLPIHGRTHQIRIHASFSGLPLLGDIRYHQNENVFLDFIQSGYTPFVLDAIITPRLCLHAASIKLGRTQSNKRIHRNQSVVPAFHAVLPIPLDMQWIWKTLKIRKQPHTTDGSLPADGSLHADGSPSADGSLPILQELQQIYKKRYEVQIPKTRNQWEWCEGRDLNPHAHS